MPIYQKYILPRVVNCICALNPTMKQRAKIIPEAKGVVLEIGIGSGLNLSYYDPDKVEHLIGVDPYPFKKALTQNLNNVPFSNELIISSAEKMEMDDKYVDTIVVTYTFCTIDNVLDSLSECRRILRSNGQLLFIEHGLSPDPKVQKMQNRINPFWKAISGGCRLNRDIPQIIRDGGFEIKRLEEMYIPGWKPATWNSWGVAVTR